MAIALRMGRYSFDDDAETEPFGAATYPIEEPALDPPEILKDVVDFLFPLLAPYEAVFYLYLLRRSIFEAGEPYARVSVRGLMKDVVRSARAGGRKEGAGTNISMSQTQKVLLSLESFGAIRKESEPNREGTLYKVMIPDEIAACRAAMAARRMAVPRPVDVESEVDWYNVRENRLKIFERDVYLCRYCRKQLTRFTATLDHVTPVSEGGGNGADNLVTACLACNSAKTGDALGDFLADRARAT